MQNKFIYKYLCEPLCHIIVLGELYIVPMIFHLNFQWAGQIDVLIQLSNKHTGVTAMVIVRRDPTQLYPSLTGKKRDITQCWFIAGTALPLQNPVIARVIYVHVSGACECN